MDDDGLALPHPVDDGPAAVKWQERAVIGVRWPDHGRRKAALAVGLEEATHAILPGVSSPKTGWPAGVDSVIGTVRQTVFW